MYLAYFDESGDDGIQESSSPIFVQTSFYMHHQRWQENYQKIREFRKELKKKHKFPIKLEMKLRRFLLNKRPYRTLNLSDDVRKEITIEYIDMLTTLTVKTVNVVINKEKADDNYLVLENALKYNVQRIENDLEQKDPTHKFIIITDEGRIGKMRRITRQIQRINFIPSILRPEPYRKEIDNLVEDPLPKKSHESYFIQNADVIATIVSLYFLKTYTKREWHNRLENILSLEEVRGWMDALKPILNLKASKSDKYGIVHYPK